MKECLKYTVEEIKLKLLAASRDVWERSMSKNGYPKADTMMMTMEPNSLKQ